MKKIIIKTNKARCTEEDPEDEDVTFEDEDLIEDDLFEEDEL